MRRYLSALVALVLSVGWILLLAAPVSAVCHLVSISATPNPVEEKDTNVTVTISRVIAGTGCTASIDYTTNDGTAKEPGDYTKTSGHCGVFDPPAGGPAAKCTFEVPIKADSLFEGNETFTASFSGTSPGPVSGSVTITIQDNDPSPRPATQPPPGGTSPKASPTATAQASPTPTADISPGSPVPLEEASPEETPKTAKEAQPTDEDGGAPTGLIVAAIGILVAAGAGAGLWFMRRASG